MILKLGSTLNMLNGVYQFFETFKYPNFDLPGGHH